MTKVRFLTIAVIGLIVLNAALIVGMVLSSPPAHPDGPMGPRGQKREKPRDIVVQRLQFDEGQVKQFEVFIDQHQAAIKPQDEKIKTTKGALYQLLNTNDHSAKDSLLNQLIDHLLAVETAHFDHFSDIKSICREDQLAEFGEFTKELQRLFSPKPPPKE